MFEPQTTPRVFATALGVDFPQALVNGLKQRLSGKAPDDIARVHVIVNTARMRRRVRDLFATSGATLMPKITLVGEIGHGPEFHHLPRSATPLARRMELVPLVHKLVQSDSRLAVRHSLFDLSDSLAALLDEMQGEGVPMSAIDGLNVDDASGHWAHAKSFISIIGQFLNAGDGALDPEGRRRRAIELMIANWAETPPNGIPAHNRQTGAAMPFFRWPSGPRL